MVAYDDDNRLLRDFVVLNCYETGPISKLIVIVEALQYGIQI
jgi:hypothetical protein